MNPIPATPEGDKTPMTTAQLDAMTTMEVQAYLDSRASLERRISALEGDKTKIKEAYDILMVGACAVSVPHAAERKVLFDAVELSRSIIASVNLSPPPQ